MHSDERFAYGIYTNAKSADVCRLRGISFTRRRGSHCQIIDASIDRTAEDAHQMAPGWHDIVVNIDELVGRAAKSQRRCLCCHSKKVTMIYPRSQAKAG
jgi:hypothetical protein